MKITPQQVQKAADLARLALSEQELMDLSAQMSALVAYFEQLEQLDTSDVEPTSHVVPLICPERDDRTRPSLDRDVVIGRAPHHDDEYFLVPKVID